MDTTSNMALMTALTEQNSRGSSRFSKATMSPLSSLEMSKLILPTSLG